MLLVGINYDRNTKKHNCMIEKYEKKQKNPCLSVPTTIMS